MVVDSSNPKDSISQIEASMVQTPAAEQIPDPTVPGQDKSTPPLADISSPRFEEKSGNCVTDPKLSPATAASSDPNPFTEWKDLLKGSFARMQKKGEVFTLDSGKPCVTIPNAVIEKNKKAWDSFIIGQFYEDSPTRGVVRAIVNGIWSKQRRDIVVSKMEGNPFLFRVPCPIARRRILSQSLWQIDGQTMFVAKWSPGLQPEKPQLSTVLVWLDFTGVPLQFFNRESLEHIAGLVGHPICLHPSTENLTNIEVAKVYTFIDPRKPLPEAVNARFESGLVKRIKVSGPWLPSVCSQCKKVGHTVSRCPAVTPTCTVCNSVKHISENCPRSRKVVKHRHGKAPLSSHLPIVPQPNHAKNQVHLPAVNEAASNSGTCMRVSLPPTAPQSSQALVSVLPEKVQVQMGNQCSPTTKKPAPLDFIRAFCKQNVSQEGICVDLSASLFVDKNKKGKSMDETSCDSSNESLSEEDDNPDDVNDRFIQVISKRVQKRDKKFLRAGGPSNL